MERDFMGLSSKASSVVVKEEGSDGCDDSAPLSMGMQWSFSNNGSSLSQYLCFKSAQEDMPRKTGCDPHGASTVTSNAIDSNQKMFSAVVQKGLILDNKQAGSHYALTGYPLPSFDAHTPNRPLDMKKFTAHAQTISFTTKAPTLQSNHSSTGQNVVGSTINQPSLAGTPVITPISIIPSTSSTPDITNLSYRNASKPLRSPAQMTIFYAGSVNVFNDVPPEKAQAIMLLAGVNTHQIPLSSTQGQAPNLKPSIAYGSVRNLPLSSSSFLTLPGPVSSTSHDALQPKVGSASTNETEAVKPLGTLASPIAQPETAKLASPVCSTAPTFVSSAVPLARKASLARFLEKRKERAASTMPYNVSMKSTDCITPASKGDPCLSMNSAAPSLLRATTE